MTDEEAREALEDLIRDLEVAETHGIRAIISRDASRYRAALERIDDAALRVVSR